jgi:hypothetical protein
MVQLKFLWTQIGLAVGLESKYVCWLQEELKLDYVEETELEKPAKVTIAWIGP